jgi:hypothetical protein
MQKRIGLIVAAFLVALASGLILAAPAAAAPPTIGHFQFTGQDIDEGASAACGFTITDTYTDSGTFKVFLDQQGNPVSIQVFTRSVGTVSANGITLLAHGQDNVTYNIANQTVMEVGIPGGDYLPGLGVVIQDRGRLIWSFDAWFNGGPPLVEDGPHPSLAGDVGAVCAALTP